MKRIALCIGNNNYAHLPKLNCAKNDANKMGNALKRLGFVTQIAFDLDRNAMIDVITKFTEELKDYDSCVFYYAGHGFQIEGDNILAPIDLDTNGRDQQVKMNAFPLEDLMHQLEKYLDKTKVIIFDACRDTLNNRGASKNFAPVLAPQGSIIAFSTSPGQSSSENTSSGHGYYTEALLKFVELPRVHIETVFKKTRESLAAKFGDKQIPWEHTSLIGDYYLNPNTIYDGVSYGNFGLADYQYHSNNPEVRIILEKLKSYNWYSQGAVIPLIKSLDFENVQATDLFVIGRNLYQAADGSCYDIQAFVDNFASATIPDIAKLHILNGMGYEIYFDSHNEARLFPKSGYYNGVIRLLEMNEFYGSRSFISSALCRNEDQIVYIPGQNEIMDFDVETNSENELIHVLYKGKDVLFSEHGDVYDCNHAYSLESTLPKIKTKIANQIVAPLDYVRVNNLSDNETVSFPERFTLRNCAINTNAQTT